MKPQDYTKFLHDVCYVKKTISCVNLVLILWFILLSATYLESRIPRYKYFAESLRIDGGSGKIYTQNSYTLTKKHLSLGIHRFDVVINYGATENSEIGIKFNLNDLQDITRLHQNITTISPYVKYHIINSFSNNPIDLSVGVYRTSGVIILEKILPEFYLTSIVTNFYFSLVEEKKVVYTLAFSKYTKWVEIMIDSNLIDKVYSIGARWLLTPDIKLNLFILDLKNLSNILFNNFVFGITIKT